VAKDSPAAILRIGVTGGIGSGKSLVCSMFAKKGIPIIPADEIAKQVMKDDRGLRLQLISLLGPATYRSDGSLDRAFVASKIFSDTSIQKKVNHLVHPRVESEIEKQFSALEQSNTPIGIVEAALIYESGFNKSLDAVIVVVAPETDRIKRVVARDKSSIEQVKSRIAAQMAADQKASKADYIIHNSGSIAQLESSVQFLLTILQNITKKR
jgi:dephospho-CoA kinase